MELLPHHLQGAKVLLEDVESKMRAVFDRIAMTEGGSLTEEVFAAINSASDKDIRRSDLLRKFGHKIGAQDLVKIIETLVLQQRVKIDTGRSDGKLHYKVLE